MESNPYTCHAMTAANPPGHFLSKHQLASTPNLYKENADKINATGAVDCTPAE